MPNENFLDSFYEPTEISNADLTKLEKVHFVYCSVSEMNDIAVTISKTQALNLLRQHPKRFRLVYCKNSDGYDGVTILSNPVATELFYSRPGTS